MPVYHNIRTFFDDLSRSEQKVARYCLDNYVHVGNYTLAELAKNIGCGEATIVRFCKKVHFESYHTFRKAILSEVRESLPVKQDSYMNDIYSNIRESIEYTINNIDENQIEEMAQLLLKANKILCSGVGNSGIPAESCAMRFLRNGKHAVYLKDNHFQLIYLNEMNPGDVCILFSHSGESYDTLNCAEILKERGVTTIGITSSVVSSIAKLCDYHILQRKYDGHTSSGSLISQITQLYIADLLTTRTGVLNEKETLAANQITSDYLINKTKKEITR